MVDNGILWKLEGLQTVETVMKILGYSRQATLNLFTKLRKEEYLTSTGGGKQKRLYRISMKKQRKRSPGMWDIINKYSPYMKLNPWYDHQVHGKYGPEEALIDAIKTRSFRIILASLRLYSHIKDWKTLFKLAKENDLEQEVLALYELAKRYFRIKRIPKKYTPIKPKKWKQLTQLKDRNNFPEIQNKFKVYIPFNINDLREAG